MEIRVLNFVKEDPRTERSLFLRLKKEKTWIHRLRTPAPTGLNIFD